MLNPSVEELLLLNVELEAYGEHAKKKRARRRHDFIDGSMKSYCRWINDPQRMSSYQEYLGMTAVLSEVRRREDEKKEAKAAEKKSKDDEKHAKRVAREAAEEKKKLELLPGILEDLKKGKEDLQALNLTRLKDMLVYGLEVPKSVVSKLKKPELLAAIMDTQAPNDDEE
jgi:hypothetical protein